MKTYTNATEAALDLYGVETDASHARVSAIMRSGLRTQRGPLAAMQLTYGETMPAAAYLVLCSTFGGRANATFSPMPDSAIPRDGFYAKHSTDFHADSVEHEEIAARIEETSRAATRVLISKGVNVMQAADLLPMSTPVTAVFSGSVLDFADLYEEHAPIKRGSHPAARQFALGVWTDISLRNPALVEAYREAAR